MEQRRDRTAKDEQQQHDDQRQSRDRDDHLGVGKGLLVVHHDRGLPGHAGGETGGPQRVVNVGPSSRPRCVPSSSAAADASRATAPLGDTERRVELNAAHGLGSHR
jgi:hypothetical protein